MVKMLSERAQKYAQALRDAQNVPLDATDSFEMQLPAYADSEKLKNAQKAFWNNFFSGFYSMYLGLLAILAIPTILNVLVHTQKSSSDYTAFRRYMETVYHTLLWFRHDLTPGTNAWKSLEGVRRHHLHASKSAKKSNVGMINQADMAITQYGFMGFAVLSKNNIGTQMTEQELDDYCHFWRVLGWVLGIKDEFNICAETYEETLERLEVVRTEYLRPNLKNPPTDFEAMTKYVTNGLWCFNPADSYASIIFAIKRMVGVEGYYYNDSDIPSDYDQSKLIYKTMSWSDRFDIWSSVFIHENLLQYTIIRRFFNFQTWIHELLIRYFPFLAMYKFGFKKAYVTIPADKDKVE